MIWISVFLLSIAQGLFLIPVLLRKGVKNRPATVFLLAAMAVMLITNLTYLSIRTDLIRFVPHLYLAPLGLLFLFGPLLFLYSRSILDPAFRWKPVYALHFLPYLVYLGINLPLYARPGGCWIWASQAFLAGELVPRSTEKIMYLLQDTHLLIYLLLTLAGAQVARRRQAGENFLVPLAPRLRWVTELCFAFGLFLATVATTHIAVLARGTYIPVCNYGYTVMSSLIIYFIVYRFIFRPEQMVPDFARKYQAIKNQDEERDRIHIRRLDQLFREEKIFTNPDLKLGTLAAELNIPQYQLSRLINEYYGKSFTDLVSEYRVQEFILRIEQPEFAAFSIFGIAMDVGFKTKSSFHTTFKKLTGKTPSAFRTSNGKTEQQQAAI